MFNGLEIVVEPATGELTNMVAELKNTITNNGGVLSRIVTEEVSFVIVCDIINVDHSSPRLVKAQQHNIPVLSSEYIDICLRLGKKLPHDDFVVIIKTVAVAEQAAVPTSVLTDPETQKRTEYVHPSRVQVWTWGDPNSPPPLPSGETDKASQEYVLVKSVLLQKLVEEEAEQYCVVEIHTISRLTDITQELNDKDKESMLTYRVFTHCGVLQDVKDIHCGSKECRYILSGTEAEQVYSYMYNRYIDQGFQRTTDHLSRWIGSPVYRKKMLQSHAQTMELADEVEYMVDFVWREAMGTLAAILNVPVRSMSLEKVEKAEAILLDIRRAIDSNFDEDEIRSKSEKFFEIIPHRAGYEETIMTKQIIARKQDICQLIKDIVNANESTGWAQLSDTVSKYRALNCMIEWLQPGHVEREEVEELVISTQEKDYPVTIRNVFAVSRSIEEAGYNHSVGNDKLMLHCSRPANFLGILSRGLLLPKIVVSELGIKRRDAGLLGSGLYFGDRLSTASLYSSPSELTGTRLMVVTKVALGNIKEIYEHDTTIEEPPVGYNSTHGVACSDDVQSQFTEDEFVVYSADQQCIQYVVEFTFPDDNLESFKRQVSVEETDSYHQSIEKPITKIDVVDIQCAFNPAAKVQPGLVPTHQVENQSIVELQSVHVRAQIQDLAAQVIVFQSYKNHNDTIIEAKYVFPLDDEAAVCGFEAFINDKHVVGVVKEKEQAKQEYRKAIREGHGAYLMDEEAPNIFSVSIGNLPPKANVLIKITYVTELSVDGGKLAFSLLGSVAPWKRSQIKAKNEADSDAFDVVHVDTSTHKRDESLQVSLHMASNIRSIESPTHTIKTKFQNTEGCVKLSGETGLGDSFQMHIGLAEIHSPRLWLETDPEKSQQAVMLVFYPDFVTDMIHDPEIILMIDLSNSMQGNNLQEAKTLSQLLVKQLPAACTFNVIIFGTEYEELYPCSQTKSKSTMDKALEFIQNAEANRGSTEAWNLLHAYFLLKQGNKKPCNIFFVSDGHVSNEEATLQAIRQNRDNSRIFTFGISSTADHHMLRSMSRLGGGTFEYFDVKAKSTWEKKLKRQINRCRQPAVSNIHIEWEKEKSPDDNQDILQAPAQITTVFSGSRLVVYALVESCTQVVLKADIPAMPYGSKEVITKFATEDIKTSSGKVLHCLAARTIVQDWEEGALHSDRLHHEARKMELQSSIVPLSVEYNIITPFTSFIAVEERQEGDNLSTKSGPPVADLITAEDVDDIPSLEWQDEVTPKIEADPERHVANLLRTATVATETMSFDSAEKYYENAFKVAEEKLKPESCLALEVADKLSKFYFCVRRNAKEAFSVINKVCKKQQTVKPQAPEQVIESEELERLDQLEKAAEWAQLCQSLEDSFEPSDIGPPVLDEPTPLYEEEIHVAGDESPEVKYPVAELHYDDIPASVVVDVPSVPLSTCSAASPEMVVVKEEYWVEDIIEELEPELLIAESQWDIVEERDAEPLPVLHYARAESPILELRRAESPVMIAEQQWDIIEEREAEPLPVLQFARAESPIHELARAESPIHQLARAESPILELRRRESPVMIAEHLSKPLPVLALARPESPVMLVAEKYDEIEEIEKITLVDSERAESPEVMEVIDDRSYDDEDEDAYASFHAPRSPVLMRGITMESEDDYEEVAGLIPPPPPSPPPSYKMGGIAGGDGESDYEALPIGGPKLLPPKLPHAAAGRGHPRGRGRGRGRGRPPPPTSRGAPPLVAAPSPPAGGAPPTDRAVGSADALASRMSARRDFSVDGDLNSDEEFSDEWSAKEPESMKEAEIESVKELKKIKTKKGIVSFDDIPEVEGKSTSKGKKKKASMPRLTLASWHSVALKRKEVDKEKIREAVPIEPLTEIPNARKGKPQQDASSIEKMLKLIDMGHGWYFTSKFDKFLGIDSQICISTVQQIHKLVQAATSVELDLSQLNEILAMVLIVIHLRMFMAAQPSKKITKQTTLYQRVERFIDDTVKILGFAWQDPNLKNVPEKSGLATDWWDIGNKLLGNVQ